VAGKMFIDLSAEDGEHLLAKVRLEKYLGARLLSIFFKTKTPLRAEMFLGGD
jgi:hypothetical protein